MIQCLETLCALNGVSGDEGQVRSYIRSWAEEHADSVRTDGGREPDDAVRPHG